MSSRRVPYGRKTLSDEQPSRADDAVITLDRVRKEFGSFAAVREAHFSIARGEFFAMLGPSGCGKTTTLKMIAGFEPLTSGRVLLEGVDVSTVPPWKRNVNTVFQHYALFPHMSVADNVAFGPRSKKAPSHEIARRVHHMLEVLRLEEFASRRPALLSGGQQQRVARARALVNLPSALLLDEPLAALDLKLREAMQLELKRIQREVGITFLFVTHDQGEALTMSDRIAVMSQGVVEQIGTPEDIYHRPASLFVAGFIGSANLLPGTAAGHDGEATVVQLSSGASIRASGGLRGPSQGDRVSVMLRPERLRATVVDLIFRGATARLQLALVDGTELVTYVESHAQLPFLRPGEQIWVTWDPGSAYLVSGWPAKAGATSTDVDQMDRLTADVAGLIDAAGAGSTVLVGHDWGGGIAWTTALERLIIMNAPHPALFLAGLLRWPQLRRSWYIFAFQLPVLPELVLRRRRARAIAGAFRRMAVDKTRFPDEVLEVYRRQALEPGALTAMINYYRANRSLFRQTRAARPRASLTRTIDVPTLMIWGEADAALGKELTYGTERLVTDLTVRYLPGVSHWVQQEAPELVNELIETWLTDVPCQKFVT